MAPHKTCKLLILTSDKVDFKLKLLKRDKEGHFILIKGAIHQEEITVINLYAPNVSVPNFIKHTLKDLKTTYRSQHSGSGRLNTLLSRMDRSSRQKINKEILELNITHRSNGTDRCLQSIPSYNSTIYVFLSSPWNFLQNRSYLRAQSSLTKYKKIEITPCILSKHNEIKLEIKRNETT
jgi:hypothetical protein